MFETIFQYFDLERAFLMLTIGRTFWVSVSYVFNFPFSVSIGIGGSIAAMVRKW